MMKKSLSIRNHAVEQLANLLHGTGDELRSAARATDAEAIHRLRVSIRRLFQAFRVFKQFTPDKETGQIHDALRDVIKAAGNVRDCDILLDALAGSGFSLRKLKQRRTKSTQILTGRIKKLLSSNPPDQWPARLGMKSI